MTDSIPSLSRRTLLRAGAGTVAGLGLLSRGWPESARAATTPTFTKGGQLVPALLANKLFTIGHRGGDRWWAEGSLYGYQKAAAAGVNALEISLARSRDLKDANGKVIQHTGTWFGSHDQYINRVAVAKSGVPPVNATKTDLIALNMPWTRETGAAAGTAITDYQIKQPATTGSSGGPQEFMPLETLVKNYSATYTIFIDPKYGPSTVAPPGYPDEAPLTAYPKEIIDILVKYVPLASLADHFILKYSGDGRQWIDAFNKEIRSRSTTAPLLKTWGYFFAANQTTLPPAADTNISSMQYVKSGYTNANAAAWTLLGLDLGAPTGGFTNAQWWAAAASTYKKPLSAFLLDVSQSTTQTKALVQTSVNQGATGLMLADPLIIS